MAVEMLMLVDSAKDGHTLIGSSVLCAVFGVGDGNMLCNLWLCQKLSGWFHG